MTLFRNRYRVESTRLRNWDYSQRGWYFVTICTHEKKCSLGQVSNGGMALSQAGMIGLRMIPSHYSNVKIDCFVVMPNHVHMIVVIEGKHLYSPKDNGCRDAACGVSETRQDASLQHSARFLADVIGGYKSGVSRRCHLDGIAGFAWQSRFHDHILSCNAAVSAVREYIDRNPENWASDPDFAAA